MSALDEDPKIFISPSSSHDDFYQRHVASCLGDDPSE
jgi:hypothetical protein